MEKEKIVSIKNLRLVVRTGPLWTCEVKSNSGPPFKYHRRAAGEVVLDRLYILSVYIISNSLFYSNFFFFQNFYFGTSTAMFDFVL